MLSEDELALIEAIRKCGSLSRAAVKLGKAPSTVSYAARQLEERFDALLFDRRHYRLELTPAGCLLANEAARVMQESCRITQRVKQIASGWEERLWIVSDEIFDFELIAPLIGQFDCLQSGVDLRFTTEVLGGTWEALRDGRATLIIGATNEPSGISDLRWFEMGQMDWVFAVARNHPLARVQGALPREAIQAHRAVVVADSSRDTQGRIYGTLNGQRTLAVPSMRAKIHAQSLGLGVGWLPRKRVASLLARGEMIEKCTVDPREPNVMYVAWRGDREGRALAWWLDRLRDPKLAAALLDGRDVCAPD
ncbi:LysR family transcriptional regulator [Duganella sp. PWIR1]